MGRGMKRTIVLRLRGEIRNSKRISKGVRGCEVRNRKVNNTYN